MQACKYNVKEFAEFTSGKKKIKPALTDDWQVTTGGFRNSNDVLNLTSRKLSQTIFDIDSSKFFDFMKKEDVTMKGNDIEGSFAIGTQRVLRKEVDYLATMSKITERKSAVIAKKDMILGHEYETVCGSTFIFAGTRYFVKTVKSKTGIRLTKNKKYYLSFGTGYLGNIHDVTSKKVVKDLGIKRDKVFLDKEIEKYISKKNNNVLFSSEISEKQSFTLTWVKCDISLFNKHLNFNGSTIYIKNKDGFVYMRNTDREWSYKKYYSLLQEDSENKWEITNEDIIIDEYEIANIDKTLESVIPKWIIN